jgi:hypothetical protein
VGRPRGFHCHKRIPTLFQRRRYQVEKHSAIHNLDNIATATPVDCTSERRSLNISHTTYIATRPDADEITERQAPQTLHQRIQQLHSWQTPLLEHIEPIQAEPRLHHLLTQDTPITFEVASDGGASEDLG